MARTNGSASKAHQIFKRHVYGDVVPRFDYCIHVDGRSGQQCGKPTKDGAQRCEACETRRRTCLDRVPELPASLRAAKGHPWAEESFDFATRKKRRRQAA